MVETINKVVKAGRELVQSIWEDPSPIGNKIKHINMPQRRLNI